MKAIQTFSDEYLEKCKAIELEARLEFLEEFAKINIDNYLPEYEARQKEIYNILTQPIATESTE